MFSKERRLFLLHWASSSCFAVKESRTQLLPLHSVGLFACCWRRRNLSIVRQLFCEHWFMAEKKDGSQSSGSCYFQCDVARVFTTLHHGEMKFAEFCAWKCTFVMHICHCCRGVARGKQAGKLKLECWREGGGTAQSHRPGVQQTLFFSCLFIRAELWYLRSQPVIQSPVGESCSSFTHCTGVSGSIAVSWQPVSMLFQVLFSPSIQWYCRQLLFPFFS